MPTTQLMNLNLPTVTVTAGPEWASQLNTALESIDAHDHSVGKGAKITPLGLNINADLTMGSNNLIAIRSARFSNNGAALNGASDLRSVYVAGNNLYYNTEAGVAVQLTSGASIYGPSIGAFTASRAIATDSLGLLEATSVTATELGRLSGILSSAVGISDAQTLTNKTIDADSNTITNIEDADIKAGAAIARSKLASGTASHVLVNDGSGVMSSEAQLAKSRGGTGADNSSVTFPGSGTVATVPSAGVVKSNGSELSASDVDLTAEVSGVLPKANGGAGADMSSVTFPTSGTIVTEAGTHVLTNKDIDGGTASNTSRITIPKEAKTTLDGLTRKEGTLVFATDEGKLYVDDGALLKAVGSGSGSGINYASDLFDGTSTTGLNAYADAASETPTDGTGGSANVTVTTNTTTELRGTSNQRFSKDAADRQGEGWSWDFTLARADHEGGKPIFITFRYETSANYADGDVRLFVYDKDATTLLNVVSLTNDGSLSASSDPTLFTGVFYPNSSNDDYRLIWHVTSTNASAYDIDIIDLKVGPEVLVPGAIITPWVSVTPTFTGLGTVTSIECETRRVGSDLQMRAKFTTGTPTATEMRVSLVHQGVAVTSAGTSIIPTIQTAGVLNFGTASAAVPSTGSVLIEPSVGYFTFGFRDATSSAIVKRNGSALAGSSETLTFFASAPIADWQPSAALSTTDALYSTVYAKATGNPASVSAGNIIIFPTSTDNPQGAYSTSTGRFTAPKTGRYLMTGFCNSGNAGVTVAAYVNGVSNTNVGQSDSNGQFTFSGTFNLNQGDLLDLRPGNTLDVTGGSISFVQIPDFSIFSVYGNFDLVTATSAQATPGSSGIYVTMTSNSLTLPPGTWRLFGSGVWTSSGGTPNYTNIQLGWYGANGGNSGSVPALISSLTGVSVLSAGDSQHVTYNVIAISSDAALTAQEVIIRNTQATTIYLVPFTTQSTSSVARITVYANAERIQ